MYQTTIDDFLEGEVNQSFVPKLISNETEMGFHWIRITKGCVPVQFNQFVELEDNDGFDEIYVNTKLRNKIIEAFDGDVVKRSIEGGNQH